MSAEDLNIYNVKISEEKLGEIDKGSLPAIPHFITVLGRIRSGKSLIAQNLYLSPRFYGNDFDVKILISPTAVNDAQCIHMIDNFDFVFDSYNESLLDEILDMIKNDETNMKYILVLDDAIDSNFIQSKSGVPDRFSQLITRFRHVGNSKYEGKLSICLLIQYFKFLTPICRNNSSAMILAGEFPQSELKKVSESFSYFGGDDKAFMDIYNRSRSHPNNCGWDFLYLNTKTLTARRNFSGEVLWSRDLEMAKNKIGGCETEETEEVVKPEEKPEKKKKKEFQRKSKGVVKFD